MKRKLFPLFVLILVTALVFPGPAYANPAIITVNSTADTATAGDGYCTLREAVDNANGDSDTTSGDCAAGSGMDTILFDSGLGTATIVVGSQLEVVDADLTTIDGDNRITVSGGDSTRVFEVTGRFTLQNISVVHGYASDGAGLYATGHPVIISHSTFDHNYVTSSGGGVAHNNAVYSLTILDSTFSNNHADADGGGVLQGGGGDAYMFITNSTFTGNSASYGGGVMNNNANILIVNTTFSGNTATGDGGAISTWKGGAHAPVTTIYNSILANSIAPEDCWMDSRGTLTGGNNIIETTASGDASCSSVTLSTSDPQLGSLTGAPAYFPLNVGSPAIDTGDDSQCPGADQRGSNRYTGSHCDIGSYEMDNSAPTDINLSTSSVTENAAVGTKVGALTTADVDVLDTHTYSLSCAGVDNAFFNIGGVANDELQTAAIFDYETKNVYNICIRTDDGHGGIYDENFVITVTNLNEIFRSVGAYDGWILESSENSNAGGTMDSSAGTFNLGDGAADKQYRALLHFDTGALPDNAVITKVTLKIKKQGQAGTNPFTILGSLKADMRKPYFGPAINLAVGDFQAAAGKTGVATFGATPVGGWYSALLSAAGRAYVNKNGTTQFRLYFTTGDNDDMAADYMKFYSGSAGAASRPQLIVEFYYVP